MFKKWVEIENHYQEKFIDKFFFNCPELYEETFQVTEKIDGANFSVIVSPEDVEFAKRSTILEETDSFFDWQSIFFQYKHENFNIELVQFMDDLHDHNKRFDKDIVQLVGELYGQGIQSRVYYGSGKYWRWYATYVNGILLSPNEETEFLKSIGLSDYCLENIRVPKISECTLGKNVSIQDQFKQLDIDKNSLLTPKDYDKPNIMEGVVIRPLNNYKMGDSNFIIKYKNEKFKDIQKEKKPKKVIKISDKAERYLEQILYYVNYNRTNDLFSKMGEFTEMKQMGEYIKAYLPDVYKDFNKSQFSLKELTDNERKYINLQLTKAIVIELKNSL